MRYSRIPLALILFALFSGFTLLELWLLIWLTRQTSLSFTILLTIATAIVGARLASREGAAAWRRLREDLAAGRLPAESLAEGALVLLGGALLITPGLITDCLGLGLLIPRTRRVLARWLRGRLVKMFFPAGGPRRRAAFSRVFSWGFAKAASTRARPDSAAGSATGGGAPLRATVRRADEIHPSAAPPPDVVDAEWSEPHSPRRE